MELTLKLLECGAGKYLGLPNKPNLKSFQTVYQRALSNGVTLKPISLIASLIKNNGHVIDLLIKLKFSNADKSLAFFIVLNRKQKPCEKPLKPYQRLVLVEPANKYHVYREYVRELLKYKGEMELLNEFSEWDIPQLPVSGGTLMRYVEKPSMICHVLNELKMIWFDADFKPTKEELLDHVPNIIKLEERRLKTTKSPA